MFPLDENGLWEKNAASLKQLSRMRDRLRTLEQQIQTLQKEQP
jgi:UDP-3-O-[3-hydroxymyristoyl] glucosamine N-acyltransferase